MTNQNESSNKVLPQVKEGRSIRFHLFAAIVVYVIDGFFFGQGVITFFVAAFFALAGIFKTLFRLIKSQPMPKASLIKMGIYCACFAAVLSTIVINNKIAKNHADKVIAAVKEYKAKYNHYPNKLDELVPEFLPSVPLAKYSFAFNNFMYWRRASRTANPNVKGDASQVEGATLLYTTLPPFGRPTYDFERDIWGYLD